MLNVIGDSGKPVDWWFIYKVSKESQTTSSQPVTGGEYAYFDSEMAKQSSAKLVLSPNRIGNNQGALYDTLSRPLWRRCKSRQEPWLVLLQRRGPP